MSQNPLQTTTTRTDDKSSNSPQQVSYQQHISDISSTSSARFQQYPLDRYSQYRPTRASVSTGQSSALASNNNNFSRQINNSNHRPELHPLPVHINLRRKMMFEGNSLFYPPGYAASPDPPGPMTPSYLPGSYFPEETSVLSSSLPSDYIDDGASVSSASPAYWGYLNTATTTVHSQPSQLTSSSMQGISTSPTGNYIPMSLYGNTGNGNTSTANIIPESPINHNLHQQQYASTDRQVVHSGTSPVVTSSQQQSHQKLHSSRLYENNGNSGSLELTTTSTLPSSTVMVTGNNSNNNNAITNNNNNASSVGGGVQTSVPNYLYAGQQQYPAYSGLATSREAAPRLGPFRDILDSTTIPASNGINVHQSPVDTSSPGSSNSNSPIGVGGAADSSVHYTSSYGETNSSFNASNDDSSSIVSVTGEKKKYQCQICGKYFKRDLPRHLRTHQEVARFVCPYPRDNCPHKRGQFNRPYDFKKHLLHGHFVFDDQKTVRSFRDLKSKLHHYGTCVCGLRFEAGQWLDQHVLGGDNLCPYLVRSSAGHDPRNP